MNPSPYPMQPEYCREGTTEDVATNNAGLDMAQYDPGDNSALGYCLGSNRVPLEPSALLYPVFDSEQPQPWIDAGSADQHTGLQKLPAQPMFDVSNGLMPTNGYVQPQDWQTNNGNLQTQEMSAPQSLIPHETFYVSDCAPLQHGLDAIHQANMLQGNLSSDYFGTPTQPIMTPSMIPADQYLLQGQGHASLGLNAGLMSGWAPQTTQYIPNSVNGITFGASQSTEYLLDQPNVENYIPVAPPQYNAPLPILDTMDGGTALNVAEGLQYSDGVSQRNLLMANKTELTLSPNNKVMPSEHPPMLPPHTTLPYANPLTRDWNSVAPEQQMVAHQPLQLLPRTHAIEKSPAGPSVQITNQTSGRRRTQKQKSRPGPYHKTKLKDVAHQEIKKKNFDNMSFYNPGVKGGRATGQTMIKGRKNPVSCFVCRIIKRKCTPGTNGHCNECKRFLISYCNIAKEVCLHPVKFSELRLFPVLGSPIKELRKRETYLPPNIDPSLIDLFNCLEPWHVRRVLLMLNGEYQIPRHFSYSLCMIKWKDVIHYFTPELDYQVQGAERFSNIWVYWLSSKMDKGDFNIYKERAVLLFSFAYEEICSMQSWDIVDNYTLVHLKSGLEHRLAFLTHELLVKRSLDKTSRAESMKFVGRVAFWCPAFNKFIQSRHKFHKNLSDTVTLLAMNTFLPTSKTCPNQITNYIEIFGRNEVPQKILMCSCQEIAMDFIPIALITYLECDIDDLRFETFHESVLTWAGMEKDADHLYYEILTQELRQLLGCIELRIVLEKMRVRLKSPQRQVGAEPDNNLRTLIARTVLSRAMKSYNDSDAEWHIGINNMLYVQRQIYDYFFHEE